MNPEFLKHLNAMIEAARKADQAWDGPSVSYPEYLPSFDEFIQDLASWRDSVAKMLAPKPASRSKCDDPDCPGFFVNRETEEVERCDSCAVYPDDESAAVAYDAEREANGEGHRSSDGSWISDTARGHDCGCQSCRSGR